MAAMKRWETHTDFAIACLHQDGVGRSLFSLSLTLSHGNLRRQQVLLCLCFTRHIRTYSYSADLRWALACVLIVLRVLRLFVPAVWDRVFCLPALPAIHFLFWSGRSLCHACRSAV